MPPQPAVGSVTAGNYSVRQGDAFGDALSVLFGTAMSATTAPSFVQGNGGDVAIFQEDTTGAGGPLNYTGGNGGNYVQANSNNAIGTSDGGSSVAFNVLGQDNHNSTLLHFADFGNELLIERSACG